MVRCLVGLNAQRLNIRANGVAGMFSGTRARLNLLRYLDQPQRAVVRSLLRRRAGTIRSGIGAMPWCWSSPFGAISVPH